MPSAVGVILLAASPLVKLLSLGLPLYGALFLPRWTLIVGICLGAAVLFVVIVAAFLIWRDRQA